MSEVTFGQLESWGSGATFGGGSDQEDFLNLKEDGTYRVRMVGGPPHEFRIHWARDNNGKMRRVKCAGRDCLLCKEGDEPQVRYMAGVIDREDGRVKVLEFTRSVYARLKTLFYDDEWGEPSGYDIKIKKNSKEKSPRDIYKTEPVPRGMGPITDEEATLVKEFFDRVVLDRFAAPGKNDEIIRKLGREETPTASSSDSFKTGEGSVVASQSGDSDASTVATDDDFDF